MKIVNDDFGYIRVLPVKIEKKQLILLPFEQRGKYDTGVGKVLSGRYEGRFVLYLKHTEKKISVSSVEWKLIPTDGILAVVEPEPHEVVTDVEGLEVKPEEWIGNE